MLATASRNAAETPLAFSRRRYPVIGSLGAVQSQTHIEIIQVFLSIAILVINIET